MVHGGFCGGWVWDDVAERLADAGHRIEVVAQLPSTGTDPAALGDLRADAQHVRQTLDALAEPVVLVGHSYSGMVITELADHPKVRHSVYVTALWPQRGQSALQLMDGELPDSFVRRDDGTMQITDDFELARETFSRDLDRERTQSWLSRCVPQSFSSFTVESTAPDRTHPVTYVITAEESDGSVAGQEAFAENADHVVRLTAGHMVQLSRPDELAEVLARV